MKAKAAKCPTYAKPTYKGVDIPHVDGYTVNKTYAKMMAIQQLLNAKLGPDVTDLIMEYVDCTIDLHLRNVHDAKAIARGF